MADAQPPARRLLPVDAPFSLAATCGPAAWVGHRSPRHAWRDGAYLWAGRDGERVVWRIARATGDGFLDIITNAPDGDAQWGRRVLGFDIPLPAFADPVIAELAARFPGLRPLCDGSLFEGLVTAIAGQSISVAAAAMTQARLAASFADPVVLDGRTFHPLPSAAQLADAPVALVRESGVTWKRAEAIVRAARAQMDGELPSDDDARAGPDEAMRRLRALPLVGRWTAESALLWGIGAPDAWPTGDVALLRAARLAYDIPGMTMKDLDALSEGWRSARGLAARLLWTNLFGTAPLDGSLT